VGTGIIRLDGNEERVMNEYQELYLTANEGRKCRNAGEDIPKKKKPLINEVVTKKLATRLRRAKVGKVLGGRVGRRKSNREYTTSILSPIHPPSTVSPSYKPKI
jgi:hypothetical protein